MEILDGYSICLAVSIWGVNIPFTGVHLILSRNFIMYIIKIRDNIRPPIVWLDGRNGFENFKRLGSTPNKFYTQPGGEYSPKVNTE